MRWIRAGIVCCCFLAAAGQARAEWVLRSNAVRVEPGTPFELELVLLNDTAEAMEGVFPERLPVRIVAGAREIAGELLRPQPVPPEAVPPIKVAPGEFRKAAYTLTLPPDVEGPITVSLTGVQATPLTVIAERATPIGGAAIAAAPPPAAAPPEAEPKSIETRPEPALKTHEPMYFVVGRRQGDTTAKFQLSFKYRILDERSYVARVLPPLGKLHFGYTQTSLWDLSGDSKPFDDTSYRPSFFYLEPAAWTSADGRHNIALDGGYEHESNGQGGDESRSVNTLYIRPTWRMLLGEQHYVSIAPKIWYYLQDYADFPIAQFRGYFNLNLRFGKIDGLQLSTDYRKGTTTMGAVQVELSYALRRPFFADAGGYLFFQYFNGYGETLLDYNVKGPAQFRLGFAIVR